MPRISDLVKSGTLFHYVYFNMDRDQKCVPHQISLPICRLNSRLSISIHILALLLHSLEQKYLFWLGIGLPQTLHTFCFLYVLIAPIFHLFIFSIYRVFIS